MTLTGRISDSRIRWSLLRPVGVCLTLSLAVFGCRSRSDLVEAELRARNSEIRELKTELDRSRTFNTVIEQHAFARETGAPFCPPSAVVDGSTAIMTGLVRELTLARGTGGLDEDKEPGDEGLYVVVVPKDVDGSSVKVPGNLVVNAFEVTAEGLKIPFSTWTVSAQELQKMWESGLFSTGYHVRLKWKALPRSEKMRVVAQLTTVPENRTFEADKDIAIRLIGRPVTAMPGMIVPSGPKMPPIVAPEGEQLPPPTRGGPLLNPTSWFRGERPPAATIGVAKPAMPSSELPEPRLLDPELPR